MGMGIKKKSLAVGLSANCFALFFVIFCHAQSVSVPLKEKHSSPAIDLVDVSGVYAAPDTPLDPEFLRRLIKDGLDSSIFEPKKSILYSGTFLATQSRVFALDDQSLRFDHVLSSVSGLVRMRVSDHQNQNRVINFSLDNHAALARNALLRALGYTIPVPTYAPKVTVVFPDLAKRNDFLDQLADMTLTSRGRWVVGGITEVNRNLTKLTFQDVVIEDAILESPPMHWGFLSSQQIQSRRSIRSLIVPLTLLDVPESLNLYTLEPAKVFSGSLVFSRSGAEAFKNETTIGDVRWIANRMAALTHEQWSAITRAGLYPKEFEALILKKTLTRVDYLMRKLKIKGHTPFNENPFEVNNDSVSEGKVRTREQVGYAGRYSYGDPKNPLRATELIRFFGIEGISNSINSIITKANQYMQFFSPDSYIKNYQRDLMEQVIAHNKENPGAPFIQPIKTWGGPISGINVNASRSVISGTYYGSQSEVQLVDAVSAGVKVGLFGSLSGIKIAAISNTAQVSVQRSYVHVRPMGDLGGAWKTKWKEILVPHFMSKLGAILQEDASADPARTSAQAMEEFLNELKPGEMFIVVDSLGAANSTQVSIPVGALLGLGPIGERISEGFAVSEQFAVLSRTTIYRDAEGIHVYLSKIRSAAFDFQANTDFFMRIFSYQHTRAAGNAHTSAFILPEKLDSADRQSAFLRSMRAIMKRNNSAILEEEFTPYLLDHTGKTRRNRAQVLPFSWTRRESFHRLDIMPPEDPRYDQEAHKRTVLEGQLTQTRGTDIYGFFGGIVKSLLPILSIGNGMRGDDPSTNFLGRSKVFSVASEVEISPNRPNHFITTLRQSYNGWSMKKAQLLRLIEKIKTQVGVDGDAATLINEKEFELTHKIQSYSLMWSLLIYDVGLAKVLPVLDLKNTPTKRAMDLLVDVMGHAEYEKFCKSEALTPAYLTGPLAFETAQKNQGMLMESREGQMTIIGCVTPWMRVVFDYRSRLFGKRAVFLNELQDEEAAKVKIQWIDRFFSSLAKHMKIQDLVKWVGSDQAFLQVRISGFRTKDENGDSEYFSNTIGRIRPDVLAGPLSDIEENSRILKHELGARYLSDGY